MAEQMVGVRKWLNDQGYGDSDIGYSGGNVTLKGKNLLSATPQATDNAAQGLYKDSTYATGSALQNALSGYQNTFGKPVNNAMNSQNAFDTYASGIKQAPKPVAAPTPFSYDYNTDPQYQNYMAAALKGAQQASNNAQSQLGARGIGNSSIASNMSNQIQQSAVGDVNSRLLPQLVQQAYDRYKYNTDLAMKADETNYGRNRDYLGDMRGLSGDYTARDKEATDLANALSDRKYLEQQRDQLGQDRRIKQARDLTDIYGTQVNPMDDYENVLSQVKGLTPMARQIQDFNQANTLADNERAQVATDNSVARESRLSSGPSSKTSKEDTSGVAKVSTAQFNDAFQTLQKKYGVAKYKETGKDAKGNPIYDESTSPTYSNSQNPDQQAKLVIDVLDLGLNDDQTLQMWNKLGITEEMAQKLLGG